MPACVVFYCVNHTDIRLKLARFQHMICIYLLFSCMLPQGEWLEQLMGTYQMKQMWGSFHFFCMSDIALDLEDCPQSRHKNPPNCMLMPLVFVIISPFSHFQLCDVLLDAWNRLFFQSWTCDSASLKWLSFLCKKWWCSCLAHICVAIIATWASCQQIALASWKSHSCPTSKFVWHHVDDLCALVSNHCSETYSWFSHCWWFAQ